MQTPGAPPLVMQIDEWWGVRQLHYQRLVGGRCDGVIQQVLETTSSTERGLQLQHVVVERPVSQRIFNRLPCELHGVVRNSQTNAMRVQCVGVTEDVPQVGADPAIV
jgi:hypothetical protein